MFASLSDSSLELLAKHKQHAEYFEDATFSEKGQPADEVYCLREGGAKVTFKESESESIVRMVAPGDMLGYRCIFSTEKFRATASAMTPSSACKISRDMIYELIAREPSFAFELLKRMGQEVTAAEYRHHSFCKRSVRERLAEGLLILKDKFGSESIHGWKINVHLRRVDLANWIGTAKESVIRCMTDFREEQFIWEDDRFIYLKDLKGLSAVAGA